MRVCAECPHYGDSAFFSHPDCNCRFRNYTGSAALSGSRTIPPVGNLTLPRRIVTICSILLLRSSVNLFLQSFYYFVTIQPWGKQKQRNALVIRGFHCKQKQVMGIEPTYLAWKASVLPLNYTCANSHYYKADIKSCQLLF